MVVKKEMKVCNYFEIGLYMLLVGVVFYMMLKHNNGLVYNVC